jgi:PIN domain nuclease of toxin-antitoxin system
MHDPANRLFLSYASIWEMQLKHQKGKLLLRKPLRGIVREQCSENGLALLPIEPTHIYALDLLPFHHTDPFDRLILAQAKSMSFTVVSDDAAFPAYGVPVLW